MKTSHLRKIAIVTLGLFLGIFLGAFFFIFKLETPLQIKTQQPKQVIGFLPYWLLDKAKVDYSNYITTLTYFGLTIDGDGHIVKLTNPQETNPAWHALDSGKLNSFLASAQNSNIKLSLLISCGDTEVINHLINRPVDNAKTLVKEVMPLMKKYRFKDLNLDIEYTPQASLTAQTHFIQFIKTVRQQVNTQNLGTLTIEVSPTDVIKQNLINTQAITPFVDTIVLMAYDYHSPTSIVAGPIAPMYGAGVHSEYDVTTAVEQTLQAAPPGKIILGVPLYGYEWETLDNAIRSAIIPGTGVLASAKRMDEVVATCATCSAFFDNESQEEYVTYKDSATGTFHEIFFPNEQSVQAKIDLVNKKQLGGIGIWALGYEGNQTLKPLANFKQE